MNVRRFFAKDMRQGLHMVQDVLGPDVVILSNTKVNGGIELIVSEDYEESDLQAFKASQKGSAKTNTEQSIAETSTTDKEVSNQRASGELESVVESSKPIMKTRRPSRTVPHSGSNVPPKLVWTEEPLLTKMREEMQSLRGLIEDQMSGLAWGDLGKRHPIAANVMVKLCNMGFAAEIALHLVEKISHDTGLDQAWVQVKKTIFRQIRTSDELLNQSYGKVALVGPAGVGKTTTIAKLAIAAAQKNGTETVSVVNMDNERIGAHSEIQSIGQISGIVVEKANTATELQQLLDDAYDRNQVFIDNSGIGCSDPRLQELADKYTQSDTDIDIYLVLSATTQHIALRETINAYQCLPLKGIILTHLDEVMALGTILSVMMQSRLPLYAISNGQQIPNDLHPVDIVELWEQSELRLQKTEDKPSSPLMNLSQQSQELVYD